jgi:actin-related protein
MLNPTTQVEEGEKVFFDTFTLPALFTSIQTVLSLGAPLSCQPACGCSFVFPGELDP